MNERAYARFYYVQFIAEYPHIYADDAAFATWLRLLAAAEAMWPARPELPRSVRTRTLAKLIASELVETDGVTYSVRGLDAERGRRSDAARNAAALRWHKNGNAVRNANGNADPMPSTSTSTSTNTREAKRDGTPVGRARPGLVKP